MSCARAKLKYREGAELKYREGAELKYREGAEQRSVRVKTLIDQQFHNGNLPA